MMDACGFPVTVLPIIAFRLVSLPCALLYHCCRLGAYNQQRFISYNYGNQKVKERGADEVRLYGGLSLVWFLFFTWWVD